MSLRDPILVTGCPRSGNSMVAGIVYLCGAFGGNMAGSSKHTKKGSFQNVEIRNRMVRQYLSKISMDSRGQNPIPEDKDLVFPENFRMDTEMIVQYQGCGNELWFYKDICMTLMWPIWQKAFPSARWIIVRRNHDDIVNSCLKTGYMDAFNDKESWSRWVHEYEKRFEEMKRNRLNIFEVWPSKFLSGDLSEIVQAIKFVGLKWKDKRIKDFLEIRQGEVHAK